MNFAKKLQNIWIFKTKTNFMLFFGGFSSTGYFIARQLNEQKFQHPMVQESTRLLQKNSQLIELLGYPIVVNSGLGSRADISEDNGFFAYKAKGPKGHVQIDLEGEAKTHAEIQQMIEIEKKEQLEQKKQELEVEKKKNKKLDIENTLKQFEKEIEDKIKKQYYILDPTIYKELTQMSEQNEDMTSKQIEQDAKFWKITNLSAELGGQYNVKILPEGKDKSQEIQEQLDTSKFQDKSVEAKKQQIKLEKQQKIAQQISENNSNQLSITGQDSIPYFKPSARKNFNDLIIEEKRRQGTNVQDDQTQTLSDQELEEMRKFKMQQLYKKIGYIRFYMMLVIIGGGMGAYTYLMKNKRVNIVGSQLHMYTNTLLQRHPLIKKQMGQNIRFSQSLRGSQIGNEAEFENDFFGDKYKGIAKVKGLFNENTSEWKITELNVEFYDFKEKLVKKQKLI